MVFLFFPRIGAINNHIIDPRAEPPAHNSLFILLGANCLQVTWESGKKKEKEKQQKEKAERERRGESTLVLPQSEGCSSVCVCVRAHLSVYLCMCACVNMGSFFFKHTTF